MINLKRFTINPIIFLGLCFIIGIGILSYTLVYISKQNNITATKNSEVNRYQLEFYDEVVSVIDTTTGDVHLLNGVNRGKTFKLK